MSFLATPTQPLGMGCWPIGGAMYSGADSLGYTQVDDAESLRTIHAALDNGITLFDTAAAYGAGHSERLLGRALKDRPDAVIATKIGIAVDEDTKQLTFGDTDPARVRPAIEACLRRLAREHVDLVLLHDNALPVTQAQDMFEQMQAARQAGLIGAFGWSTDFSKSVAATGGQSGFEAVEHAMNVFVDVPKVQAAVHAHGLTALIRSPLAMGLLGGRYAATSKIDKNDIRAGDNMVIKYFENGAPNPEFLTRMDAIRETLCVDGRSLVQGALGWIWAKNPANIPIPGARTVAQIEGIAGALPFGPLPQTAMQEIEQLIDRKPADAAEQEL